jgi:Ca-activated chloride channel family protein
MAGMVQRTATQPLMGQWTAWLGALALAATALAKDPLPAAHQLGDVSAIIVPQARSFVVDCLPPPPPPVPAPMPSPRPIEQRGQAVVIESVEARVNILEQAASTTLDIAIRNPGPQQVEAILLLPVPEGAAVSSFAFDGPASEPTARVLTREEARRLYDEIVGRVRDPALLEFAGYQLIRSSVFPVAGGGRQKIRLTYDHILESDGNRVDYVLPRSESLNQRTPWRITVDCHARHPISSVYSPTHDLTTERRSADHLTIALAEADALTPGPFILSCLLDRHGLNASVFAYPDPAAGGGYFLLMAGLPASLGDAAQRLKREVTIVIDRSGSMAGAKMDQARAAALQVVEGLAEGEAFNIIDYSTTVTKFAERPIVKTAAIVPDTRRYIQAIQSGGGTNIHDALVEALIQQPTPDMLPLVLFLTDGLPTVGQTSEAVIRDLAEKGNPHDRRIFAFGVGHDVNVPLLDRLADVTRAVSTYVLPEEDVELKVAQTFRRLYGPVFADPALRGADELSLAQDLLPASLPDVYEGDQLIVLGRYRDAGRPIQLRLSGRMFGKDETVELRFEPSSATTRHAFVPRLWASRRIAYLVDLVRQAGAPAGGSPTFNSPSIFNDPRYREIADEILTLSTKFGILTEYTAFLATEGTNLSDWESLRLGCGETLDRRAVGTRSGAAAVNQGMNFNDQKAQSKLNYDNRYWNDQLEAVQTAAVQQVNDCAFFKRGTQWIDSRLIAPPGAGATQPEIAPDVVVEYGSAEHLALLHALAAENRQGLLALEGDVMVQYEGRNILVRNDTVTHTN